MANSTFIRCWPVHWAQLHTTVNIVVRELATLYSIYTGELSQKGKLISQNTVKLCEGMSGIRNILIPGSQFGLKSVGFCHERRHKFQDFRLSKGRL
jgi:hypothetical protein